MSFLKIKDPAKRDLIVKEYLETKKNVRRNQIAEKTGEIELQSDLSKLFKPITEAQKTAMEEITKGLIPIKAGIEGLQQSIKLPNYPGIEFNTTKGKLTMGKGDEMQTIGPIASWYLTRFAEKADIDKTYGLYSKNGKFYIGNKMVTINNNDISLGNDVYKGTPGFWELITSKNPDSNIFTQEDYERYSDLVVKSNTLYRNNNPNSNHPKSSKGKKWELLRPIWDIIKPRGITGEGIIIPCDPNALLQKLDLLIASKAAGNTGVRNEIVSVCDELKRQGHLDKKSYKKLMSIL